MPAMLGRSRTARTSDGLTVVLRPLATDTLDIDAWRSLSRRALVENFFFEPDFLLAAGATLESGISLLLVCDRPPEEPAARLLALWPCRVAYRWGLPIPVLMGWMHDYAVFGAPLIDRSDAERALSALLDAPRRLGLPPRVMMTHVPLDGPLDALLKSTLAKRGGDRADFWAHERGALALAGLSHAERSGYLAASLSASKARQLHRLFRRLEAEGPVIHEIVRDPADLADALDDYLALEAAGWKGGIGTAAGNRPHEVAFLKKLIRDCGARGNVRIDRLRRNERSLAVSIAFETDSTLWYLKIAHDETESRNSPGAQLAYRVTRSVLADHGITSADSCAPPDFPMITTFWADRRPLAHALIDTGGDRLFPLAVRLETLRARVADWRARRAKRARG